MTFSILDFSRRTDQPQAEPILDWGEEYMDKKSSSRFPDFRSDNPKSKIENLKLVGLLAIALTLTLGGAVAQAQQPGKVPRIGFLDGSTASGMGVLVKAFLHELSKLGWIEGRNFTIEYRFAEGKGPERQRELAADLVRLKVDLIVTTGDPSALAAKKATTTIPIVLANSVDPVGFGHVASLARPGGMSLGLVV